jgi:hypothetical protein
MSDDPGRQDAAGSADDLLRRALIDADAAATVALRVEHLPVSSAVTVIFHGRRDLGTLQTYVANGHRPAGSAVDAEELLRIPCELDLAATDGRAAAERAFAEQAGALRDALVGADTVLEVWREPLTEVAGTTVAVDRSVELDVALPAHRLMPTALVAADRQLVVAPVCGARTLADGRPPLGIACAQGDVARVYPLPDDPNRCLEDFLAHAATHAHALAEQLEQQERSINRFLELSADDLPRDA